VLRGAQGARAPRGPAGHHGGRQLLALGQSPRRGVVTGGPPHAYGQGVIEDDRTDPGIPRRDPMGVEQAVEGRERPAHLILVRVRSVAVRRDERRAPRGHRGRGRVLRRDRLTLPPPQETPPFRGAQRRQHHDPLDLPVAAADHVAPVVRPERPRELDLDGVEAAGVGAQSLPEGLAPRLAGIAYFDGLTATDGFGMSLSRLMSLTH